MVRPKEQHRLAHEAERLTNREITHESCRVLRCASLQEQDMPVLIADTNNNIQFANRNTQGFMLRRELPSY